MSSGSGHLVAKYVLYYSYKLYKKLYNLYSAADVLKSLLSCIYGAVLACDQHSKGLCCVDRLLTQHRIFDLVKFLGILGVLEPHDALGNLHT